VADRSLVYRLKADISNFSTKMVAASRAMDDVAADRIAGVDTESIEDDLVHACVTEPTFSSRAAFDEWADTLSEGEWRTLVLEAWNLVNESRFNPKALPASVTRSTEPS
jgi:hypothetical protein